VGELVKWIYLALNSTETAPAQRYWFEGNLAWYEQNTMRPAGIESHTASSSEGDKQR
jgi:hypothetical protein